MNRNVKGSESETYVGVGTCTHCPKYGHNTILFNTVTHTQYNNHKYANFNTVLLQWFIKLREEKSVPEDVIYSYSIWSRP